MERKTTTETPLDRFTRTKRPADAVRLAIADHQAVNNGRVHWEFVDALTKTADLLDRLDELKEAGLMS